MAGEKIILRNLHQLHLQLKTVKDQLDRGPRQLKIRQQACVQKEAEVAQQRDRMTKLKVAADQSNLQLKSNESKIETLRNKLNAASSNREFDIIRGQIEADTVANSVLEDEILDLLEKVDLARADLGKLEQQLVAAKADEVRVGKEIAAAESGLQTLARDIEARIKLEEQAVPPDLRAVYGRLVQAYGASAFSEVEGNMCSFCYVQLPQQTLMELQTGKVMFCKSCGRIMYFRRDD